MFLWLSERVEIRHKVYKASMDADEGWRQHQNTMVEICMIDCDRALNKIRSCRWPRTRRFSRTRLNCPEAAMHSLQLVRQHAATKNERLVYER